MTPSLPSRAFPGNRTRVTLVGGECSHHCAIPTPQGGLERGEKEGTTPVAVTDAFRINKFVNLISESDMTDGSAFFIANVNKHTNQ